MEIAPERSSSRVSRRSLAALVGCLALITLAVAGCGDDDDNGAGENGAKAPAEKSTGAPAKDAVTVDVAKFKFSPDPIKAKVGGTVTFINRDKAPHTAQTDLNPKRAAFNTDRLEMGEKRTVKLDKTGRFDYFCAYHRFMEGTVEVVE